MMVSSGMLRHVALVRIDVSEEPGASFIRVTRKEPHGVTSQKTPFFNFDAFSRMPCNKRQSQGLLSCNRVRPSQLSLGLLMEELLSSLQILTKNCSLSRY
jgi:hypothetical protein